MLSEPMGTGRSFDEVLRVLDSMQLIAKHEVATPVNSRQRDEVIILRIVPSRSERLNWNLCLRALSW
jgi:thioredoxin-dependent peroxiredoxin